MDENSNKNVIKYHVAVQLDCVSFVFFSGTFLFLNRNRENQPKWAYFWPMSADQPTSTHVQNKTQKAECSDQGFGPGAMAGMDSLTLVQMAGGC